MAEKGSPGCAASVGCTLLQALMSPGKGGSEDVCVNYDTSSALALASLNVLHMHPGSEFDTFLFFFFILTALSVCVVHAIFSPEILGSGSLYSVLWIYVSVCRWLHPLSRFA